MLEVTKLFLLKLFFVIEILVAMFLFSYKLKKRKYPALRYIITIIICLSVAVFYPCNFAICYTWWYSSIMFLLLFIICLFCLFFIYDVSWQRIFFISITSYTIQHFSYEVYTLLTTILHLDVLSSQNMYSGGKISVISDLLPFIFCFAIYVVIYFLFYLLLEKKIEKFDVNVDNNSILFMTAIILLTDIIFNSIVVYIDENYNNLYSIIVCAYNLLCCCLILYISNKIVLTQKIKTELETTSRLLRQAEEQYKVSKENVNLINLKCHDLKHQIREYASKRNIDQEAIKDLESVINIYDSTIKTGNEALDLILTEKSLYCQKQNIKLTCLADCSRLIFMHDSDLYSLFGNMIDNAIEAVSKIDNAEKRNINLIVRNIKNYVSIAVENFYEGKINLDNNGLPITTKNNTDYHGYGFKSIKMIVEKYNGDFKISIGEEIFSVYILFKVSEKNEK